MFFYVHRRGLRFKHRVPVFTLIQNTDTVIYAFSVAHCYTHSPFALRLSCLPILTTCKSFDSHHDNRKGMPLTLRVVHLVIHDILFEQIHALIEYRRIGSIINSHYANLTLYGFSKLLINPSGNKASLLFPALKAISVRWLYNEPTRVSIQFFTGEGVCAV